MISPKPPQFDGAAHEVTAPLALVSGETYDGQIIASLEPGDALDDVTLQECRLTGVELTARQIKRFDLSDCTIERSLMFGLNADGSLMRRVRIAGTQAVGLIVSASTMSDVLITGSKLDGANFRLSKLKRVHFKDCSLREADFAGAAMSEVWFDNCELAGASFEQLSASNVSVVGSSLGNLNGLNGLSGVTIDSAQLYELAPQLAHMIGIKVEN